MKRDDEVCLLGDHHLATSGLLRGEDLLPHLHSCLQKASGPWLKFQATVNYK